MALTKVSRGLLSTSIVDNGNATAITIDSSENVGIGTTSAPSRLTVKSPDNTLATNIAQFDSLNGGAGFKFGYQRIEQIGATVPITFETGGSESMRIDASGNVGIGTSSPVTALEISTDGTDQLTLNRADASISTNNTLGGIVVSADDPTANRSGAKIGFTAGANWTTNNFPTNIIFSNDASGTITERMRIDSSGNVGIGGTPTAPLHVFGGGILGASSTNPIAFTGSGGTNAGIGSYNANTDFNVYTAGTGVFKVRTGAAWSSTGALTGTGTERMRIDASGSLLVGKTAVDNTSTGFRVDGSSGFSSFVRDGGEPLYLNRKTSDGDILKFAKNNSTVGIIGTASGDLVIGTGNTGLYFYDALRAIIPWNTSTNGTADNLIDLGTASNRFDDIYATNGTIQTSDFNEKQDIAELSDAEQRVAVAAKGLLRKFRWKDSVTEKGDEARTHFGIIAQDLQAAFAAEGLDAGDYAMFISSTWTDEETNEEKTRMGVRYSELLAFIIAAI